MKILLFLFISIFAFQNVTLSEARKAYATANANKQNALNFYNELKNYSGNNQTILAYKGAALALQSKYVGTKESKKENFTKGVGYIENAIKAEPNNIEIRMIRLSVQENIPKMLKYKMNLSEDKNSILKSYNSQNSDIKQLIKSYSKSSKSFTDIEKNQLK